MCSGPPGPSGPERYDRQGPYDRRGPPPPGPGGYGRRYPDEWHPDDRHAAPDDRYGPPDDRYGAADDRYGGRAVRSPPRNRCANVALPICLPSVREGCMSAAGPPFAPFGVCLGHREIVGKASVGDQPEDGR